MSISCGHVGSGSHAWSQIEPTAPSLRVANDGRGNFCFLGSGTASFDLQALVSETSTGMCEDLQACFASTRAAC